MVWEYEDFRKVTGDFKSLSQELSPEDDQTLLRFWQDCLQMVNLINIPQKYFFVYQGGQKWNIFSDLPHGKEYYSFLGLKRKFQTLIKDETAQQLVFNEIDQHYFLIKIFEDVVGRYFAIDKKNQEIRIGQFLELIRRESETLCRSVKDLQTMLHGYAANILRS